MPLLLLVLNFHATNTNTMRQPRQPASRRKTQTAKLQRMYVSLMRKTVSQPASQSLLYSFKHANIVSFTGFSTNKKKRTEKPNEYVRVWVSECEEELEGYTHKPNQTINRVNWSMMYV